MIVKIKGNIKPYYLQTLCLTFFPGAKFPENEVETEETVVVEAEISENGEKISADVRIRQGKRFVHGSHTRDLDGECDDTDKIRKLTVGKAFMDAGVKFTGFSSPWGILTGIRPAKIASDLLSTGVTPEECANSIAEEYFAHPTKARLATSVALSEAKLILPETRRQCSIYVGIPFCPTKCAYCSFVSYTTPGFLKLIPDYLCALLNDIDGVFSLVRELGMEVASVYIGGGTPTILTADQLGVLLEKISSCLTSPVREFTLEAGRPDTIT
ncbi:MAG: hypothetical protein IJC62_03495, partial [Clostridia bacterium]|nr:hypothetical protein [Clostridia bacterium]